MTSPDTEKIVQLVSTKLDLTSASLVDEYYYNSITLCVIDSVYSIGVRYEGVRSVVQRYCDYFGIDRFRPSRNTLPDRESQEPLVKLIEHFQALGVERMASEVFRNRQRTSARNGILKAEAINQFALKLQRHGVNYLQDAQNNLSNKDLESDILLIPGQRSGISLQYFWMLAGSDDLIKPDRMILRFLRDAIGREVTVKEAQSFLAETTWLLQVEHPNMTPRLLDYKIWEYQRSVGPADPKTEKN